MIFPNWAKNILFLLVLMISGLLLIIIIEGLISGNELIPLNTAIESAITRMRTPLWTNFFVAVTKIGNPFVLTFASALMAFFLILRGRLYDAALFVTALVIAIVSLVVLKETFQIARPASDLLATEGWSFPSGHVAVATAFFFMFAYSFYGKMKTIRHKTILILSSFTATLLISLSRLYLGAHWTLDVLAGIALGLLSVSFTILVFSLFLDGRRSFRDRLG
ncbi:MAG: phosphatase PAP2 family protein [Minisyncoccia bacterium]